MKPVPSRPSPLAALRGASKRYGAVTALDAVDLEVRAGEVLAVPGANGAGKSTALGLLTGRLGPDAGEGPVLWLVDFDRGDRRLRQGPMSFQVLQDRCIGCGACSRVCPKSCHSFN